MAPKAPLVVEANIAKMAAAKGGVDKLERVYLGRLDNLPPQSSKVVRVFTSSTFTDTTTERNSLMEEVYPHLKDYCRMTHGLDFQVVDMRWGVRDEATDDHMTTQLCMNEIANCQRLSMGPNFVVFLCQKYGYRPIPTTILADELDLLKQNLREADENIEPLDVWYKLETNAVPAVYILQPISSILFNFNNKRIPKLQEQDAASWWDTMATMQHLLRKGARICYEKNLLSHEDMHNYFMSVTEREVINGILKAKHTKEHCLCYVRHINNMNLNNLRAASKFIDIAHGQIDTEAAKLLSNLRDERVPTKLDAGNIARFSVEWQGRDGIDPHNHSNYLTEFCNHFRDNIVALVDRAMIKDAKLAKDTVYTEILQHLHTGHKVSTSFCGRETELNIARQYLCSDNDSPLILYGESGCGKTSVLAKIASCVPDWLPAKTTPVILLRFLGTSPESSNIAALLTNLCEQIAFNYGHPRGEAPQELSKLFAYFKRMTCLATIQKPMVILLDSLDLLSKTDGGQELLWFPPSLPNSVKFIASTTPGASKIFTTLKRIVEEPSNYVQISTLGKELSETVIIEWFKGGHRTLTERQWELVRKALSKSTLALFVKLVFATVYRWKSYSKPQDTILSGSLHESIHALFDRTENQHGKLLVSHALSYITAAKAGISESELDDLISLDDRVLDDVYQYHLPPVRRIPPLLWTRIRADLPGYLSERAADGVIVLNWYHRQFREAANERYFKNLNHLHFTHSSLADYFLGVWGGVPKPFQFTEIQRQRFGLPEREGLADRRVPRQPNSFLIEEKNEIRYNQRKLNELPFHLLRAPRYEELFSKCLFSYDFVRSKLHAFPLQALLADFDDAYTHLDDQHVRRELVLVADALRLSASLLSKKPYMLSFELVGRLLPLISEHDRVKSLVIQCDLEGPQTNCFLPTHNCFHSPGGPLKYSLEDHPFAVFGLQLTSDKKLIVSVSNQFIVWDVHSGDIARRVDPGIDGIMFGLAISPDDKFVATFTNNNEVVLMSLITGEYQSIWPENLTDQMMISGISLTKTHVIFWTKDEWFVYNLHGKLYKKHKALCSDYPKILVVWYFGDDEYFIVYWSGDTENSSICIKGRVHGAEITQFNFVCAAVLTHDRQTLFACTQDNQVYSITKYALSANAWHSLDSIKIAPEKDQLIITLRLPIESQENYLIIVETSGYQVHNFDADKHHKLTLPDGVRNIALKPMCTTSPTALTPDENLFVAGVRKNLYVWNLAQQRLIQTIDAHFGRILHLLPVTMEHNSIVSSSIDHSIKVWNMNNIFEKSFSVAVMDQPADDVQLASENENVAAVRTRKYVAIWDVKHHRIITTLAANIYSAVVTHCLITSNAAKVITIESDLLLVWDLRTQSVVHRAEVDNVQQMFLMKQERVLVTVSLKEEDDSELKTAFLVARNAENLEFLYEFTFSCRILRKVVVQKGESFLVAVILHRNRDNLEVIHADSGTPMYRIRLRSKTKSKTVECSSVEQIFAMPHNPNQVVTTDKEHKAYIWDVKNKKLLRQLPSFTGSCTRDGKLGLYAPPRGGLEMVDMRTGAVKTSYIKRAVEGVNEVSATFSPTDRHVFYYHNGHKTLRVFDARSGKNLGCFGAHAKLTCFALTKDGRKLLIGGEDGSLLVVAIVDKNMHNHKEYLAQLPSRVELARHLGIERAEADEEPFQTMGSITGVTKAVVKFKGLLHKRQKSTACVVQ